MKLTIKGIHEIQRAYDLLPKAVANRVIKRSIRNALAPMLREAKANAPAEKGALRKSIKIRVTKRTRRGSIGLQIQTGAADFTGHQFYGAMREYGHRLGPRRLGSARKQVEGSHFLERAFEAHKEQAKADAIRDIRGGVDFEVRALAAK